MADYMGQKLGNYRVLRLLGRGGQASVYLGEHVYLKSHAALKVLHTHLADEETEQFVKEAQILARLTHPHIVRVLDFAVCNGIPFFVMEYAPSGTLRQLHSKGTRLPLDTILSYVQQVASALQYAHDQQLVHRDVKPENLLLACRGEVILSDFGLTMFVPQTIGQSTQAMVQPMVGTVAYMAPEQLQGRCTPASDQYALGMVVYEWLCGEQAFSGVLTEVVSKHIFAPPPSLTEKVPTIPAGIEQVVLKALAKEPEQRFASVQAFALALATASPKEASGQTLSVLASQYPAAVSQKVIPLRHLPTGTVTLLFTDIEGSTHLLHQLGARYASLLSECRHLLRAAFRAFRGQVVNPQEDGFFVVFARATDAVAAAAAAQHALASHSWPQDVAVRVRMSLHTGEPQLASDGYMGLDVHRAAHIMSAGHGGQVLLSQAARDLVAHDLPDGMDLRDLGEYHLKDLPGPERLFQLVIAGLPADFPPLKIRDAHPHNLPVQPTPFIGREQEVTTVQHLLRREDVRLLTLTGPGGIGKTRLALQVVAELRDLFPDGVFFVDLAPLREPVLIVSTIAQTLGIRELAGQSLLERLKEEVQQQQLLLLLDNFEQVLSAAVQVADLLAACPHLKVLVTSREVLHMRAEHEFAVPPLALPDPKRLLDLAALSHNAGVALFLQRVQAIQPDFQLTTANARAVVEICVRLDGLPLAIELAAARMKLLSPQALLARLDQRLQILTSGTRDALARQQTLRNTIVWSYQLLDAQEQRLFQRLSIFVGGCMLEAAEAVCNARKDMTANVLDTVTSLIDKSLLYQHKQLNGEPRLAMLETIREYGLEALEASGEREALRHAHATYYLRLAEEARPALEGPQQAVWLERLEQERDNLRAVMRWSLEQREVGQSMEMALRLGKALEQFWTTHGHYREGQTFLEQALAESEEVVTSVRAQALSAAARLLLDQCDLDQTEVLCEKSLALSRQIGNTRNIACSLYLLGEVAARRGNLTTACSLIEQSVSLYRESGDKGMIGYSLGGLANKLVRQGEYTRGRALLEESLALGREAGHKRGIAHSLLELAKLLFVSRSEGTMVHSLLEEGLVLYRELGDKDGIASYFSLAGRLALSQGDATIAYSLLEESLRLYREVQDRWDIAESLSFLAKVVTVQGDYIAARALYEESLALNREIGNKDIAACLEGLASVVAAQGELVRAARLWGTAESLRDAMGIALPAVYRADYERSVSAALAQLWEQAFAAAWAEGCSVSPEQALATQGRETMSEAVRASHPPRPPTKSLLSYPARLTAREVEVLQLVAQGLTNEQVANELVISARTVNTHLTSIYGKIQVSSRSAATRYAIEHHVVWLPLAPAYASDGASAPVVVEGTQGIVLSERTSWPPDRQALLWSRGRFLQAPLRKAHAPKAAAYHSSVLGWVRSLRDTGFGQCTERGQRKRLWAGDLGHRRTRGLRVIVMHTLCFWFNQQEEAPCLQFDQ